jgi:hypothetical protein
MMFDIPKDITGDAFLESKTAPSLPLAQVGEPKPQVAMLFKRSEAVCVLSKTPLKLRPSAAQN